MSMGIHWAIATTTIIRRVRNEGERGLRRPGGNHPLPDHPRREAMGPAMPCGKTGLIVQGDRGE